MVAVAFSMPQQMDMIPPGSKMASKVRTIIYYAELGKPYAFLKGGIDPVRGRNDAEGKGMG